MELHGSAKDFHPCKSEGNTCIAEPKREVLPFTATSNKNITLVKVNKDGIK